MDVFFCLFQVLQSDDDRDDDLILQQQQQNTHMHACI